MAAGTILGRIFGNRTMVETRTSRKAVELPERTVMGWNELSALPYLHGLRLRVASGALWITGPRIGDTVVEAGEFLPDLRKVDMRTARIMSLKRTIVECIDPGCRD